MSVKETPAICPVCNERSLHKHCDNPKCTWHKCRRYTDCDAVLDFKRGRGHALPIAGKGPRRNIVLGGAA